MRLDELEGHRLSMGDVPLQSVLQERGLEHIRACKALGLEQFFPTWHNSKSGAVALIAGGPTLKDHLEEIRNFPGDVIACGSVHDHLATNKVAMNFAVSLDPDKEMANFFRMPSPRTTYMVSSTSHPDLFDALRGGHIVVWHAAGEAPWEEIEGENSIAGGSTAALRAWPMAHIMGYRDVHFFGLDSSFHQETERHAYDGLVDGGAMVVKLPGDEREYVTTPGFVIQARQFAEMLQYYQTVSEVTVHGESLTAAYARIVARMRR